MKFNPKSLKQLFSAIRKSPIDDIAINAAKSNVDDLALGALDAIDDIPQTRLLNSAIPFPEGTPDNPVDVNTFKNFYNKRRAEDYAARNLFSGKPYDKSALTPGFGYDFGIPNRDGSFSGAGSAGISPRGHEVIIPPEFAYGANGPDPIYIDGKTFHYPADSLLIDEYSNDLGSSDEVLKIDLLNNLSNLSGIKDPSPYASGEMPFRTVVYGNFGEWRPHKGDALGKFYRKHGRIPKELNSERLNPYINFAYSPDDDNLPF